MTKGVYERTAEHLAVIRRNQQRSVEAMKGRPKSLEMRAKLSATNLGRAHSHGMTRTPTYVTWVGMLQRCTNPNATAYERYGGRGIIVCERWLKFENFLADMGERPDGLTLDRRDNDGNYEPGNCRWATGHEQQQNRRLPSASR